MEKLNWIFELWFSKFHDLFHPRGSFIFNGIVKRSIICSLFILMVLIIATPVHALNTTLTPTSGYAGYTSDIYSAAFDPSSDGVDLYFLNITIPQGYSIILPSSGQLVGTYTMHNITVSSEQVIISITSNDPATKRVDVNYTSDYGSSYSNSLDQNLSNMTIGLTTIELTEPGTTSQGSFNISLGGSAGPINSTHNNATLTLEAGILKNPASTGNYNWTIEAKNNPSGQAYTSYNIVQINSPPDNTKRSGGGGGGGGGGGVATSEPFENILVTERRESSLVAKKFVPFNFSIPGIPVSQIFINGKENENGVILRVEVLKGKSELVRIPPPGIVYKHLNIWASSRRITGRFIRFGVNESWLIENNLVSSDIKMVEWRGREKWVQLNTREIEKNPEKRFFEVRSNNSNNYAIVGLKSQVVPSGTPIKITNRELDIDDVFDVTQVTKKSKEEEVPEEKAGGFEFLPAIFIMALISLLNRKRN